MAHNKVYVVCEDMCMEEGMTKEQIQNAIDNLNTKDAELETEINTLNTAVDNLSDDNIDLHSSVNTLNTNMGKVQTAINDLTSEIQKVSGSVTFDNSATATVEINYPQGFGPENCIAFGGMTKGLHSAKWKNNVGITTGTSQIAINPIITFLDDKIRVEIKTTSAISQSVSYQFYLMSIGF